jgi:hypothetical protein
MRHSKYNENLFMGSGSDLDHGVRIPWNDSLKFKVLKIGVAVPQSEILNPVKLIKVPK